MSDWTHRTSANGDCELATGYHGSAYMTRTKFTASSSDLLVPVRVLMTMLVRFHTVGRARRFYLWVAKLMGAQ